MWTCPLPLWLTSTSDWYQADYKVIQPLIDSSAKAYAGEKKLPAKCA